MKHREGKMAKYDAKEIADDAMDVFKMIDKDMDLPEWLEAKITKSADYMNSVKDYLTHHMKGDVQEGYSMRDLGLSPFWKKLNPDQRQAVSIALIMGGNMSGAIKAIEKIKKGLSKDKKVKNALKMANEGFASAAKIRAAFASGYKAKGKKKKKKEGVNEITYKFKGYTASKMDELDAMLSRAGIKGTPDFNKMTYTVNYQKNPYSVNLDKIMKKKGGKKIRESINEAPGRNHKDQYYGAARVKVEPYTYKNQVRNFHDVSMYRDHQRPYNYYLSIRLAHNKTTGKVDHIVDTGTHILKKAGKWAQGFIKRRMSGTGRERFS